MSEQSQPILTEDMHMFDYWSGVYSPADQHIDSLRAAYDAFQQHYTLPRTDDMIVEDQVLHLPDHAIHLRTFCPEQDMPETGWPWIFYIHGGGNVVGSADSHEYIARQLARDLQVKVFLPEYGLVPEFGWDQGQRDCLEAYCILIAQASVWNIAVNQAAIVADGSGVAIALAVQQALALSIQPQVQAFIFPSFMPQQNEVLPYSKASLVYQVENQALMQDWTGIAVQHASRTFVSLKGDIVPSFVALTEFDLSASANQALIQQLEQLSSQVEVHRGMGLRANCLPLLRDCPEVAAIYAALLQFLSPHFLEI
ncbi:MULTISPECIES: alpha/beta hydrolase [unclassified Acinetobacter]|uniref:alpha/beta hydrolase n=1 Tax=unclassified Acinetobacter TaxID=196816 RepID=UPI002934AD1D|nr:MULTISPECIES: alpha/beta hydrolase [unclassified Acinetobacter]WOE31724.1 alpha/beta hydrolase [Acinetobacter sp. SAAs470]WOE37191.1 alpha/beta hydrolase [Acinetobacter sp. SAAs474]